MVARLICFFNRRVCTGGKWRSLTLERCWTAWQRLLLPPPQVLSRVLPGKTMLSRRLSSRSIFSFARWVSVNSGLTLTDCQMTAAWPNTGVVFIYQHCSLGWKWKEFTHIARRTNQKKCSISYNCGDINRQWFLMIDCFAWLCPMVVSGAVIRAWLFALHWIFASSHCFSSLL